MIWYFKRVVGAGLLSIMVFASLSVQAGTQCTEKVITTTDLDRAGKMAVKLQSLARKHDMTAALVGRMGSDLSRYGLRYSHLGILYRKSDDVWMFRHMLNHCGEATSGLYQEGIMNFFLDDPIRYEAAIVVPDQSLQKKLRHAVMTDETKSLFTPDYNMLANPWNDLYQNSNQWVLEVLANAMAGHNPARSRRDAQDFLRDSNYQPSRLRFSLAQRLGAKYFRSNIRFDDHNNADRIIGVLPVVSVKSVFRYLERHDLVLHKLTISLPDHQQPLRAPARQLVIDDKSQER